MSIQPALSLNYSSDGPNGDPGRRLAAQQAWATSTASRQPVGLPTYGPTDRFELDGQDLLACPALPPAHDAMPTGAPSCWRDLPADSATVGTQWAAFTTRDERGLEITRHMSPSDHEIWTVTTTAGVTSLYSVDIPGPAGTRQTRDGCTCRSSPTSWAILSPTVTPIGRPAK